MINSKELCTFLRTEFNFSTSIPLVDDIVVSVETAFLKGSEGGATVVVESNRICNVFEMLNSFPIPCSKFGPTLCASSGRVEDDVVILRV